MVDKKAIQTIINQYFLIRSEIDIHNDGSVSIKGDCVAKLALRKLEKLPIKFRLVSGDFVCNDNNLTTLEGSPKFVGKQFLLSNNKLTSLVGAPIDLKLCSCYSNPLISLEGLPDQFDILEITWNKQLPLLRLTGRANADIDFGGMPDAIRYIIAKYSLSNRNENKPSRKDILAFQRDLINAGFEGNASW